MTEAKAWITHESFEDIYRRHWQSVYAVCYHYTQSRHISEDLVQEIFLSLWERRKTLIIERSVEHYLLRAARLKVFYYLRTDLSQKKHHERLSLYYISSENATENDVLFRELFGMLHDIIEELPPKPRVVYTMSRMEGMKTKEIARELVLSEKTVKNHLTRALHFLRNRLKGNDRKKI